MNAPGNIIPVLAPTIQIYNVLNIVEILDFIEGIDSPKWDDQLTPLCHLTVLMDPQHLSIRHLPKRIRQIARERLLDFKKRSRLISKSDNYKQQFNLLVNTLAHDDFVTGTGKSSKDYLSHFLQYTHDLDNQRKQRFQDFIPELYKLLMEENIKPSYPSDDPRNFTYYKFRDTGFRLHGENKLVEALQMFQKAYEMYQDDLDLLFSLGVCNKQLNKKSEAYFFFQTRISSAYILQ